MLIVVATIAYAVAIMAFARGPAVLDSNMLGTVVNLLGTIVPFALFLISGVKFSQASQTGLKGYSWALAGGVAIGIFTLAMTRIFAAGGNVSFVTPLVYGGAVSLVTLIGIIVYKEKLPITQLLGAGVIIIGIIMIVYSRYRQGAAV